MIGLTPKKINKNIKNAILNHKPLSFGKIGNVESTYLEKFFNNIVDEKSNQLYVNAGIYVSSLSDYDEYFNCLINSIKNTDFLLQWNSTDKKLIKNYFSNNKTFKSFNGLEPFIFEEKGWHYSLKDKKVLCVSPFSKSVKAQSQNFGKIWSGAEIGCIETVSVPHSEALTGEKPVSWKIKYEKILEKIDNQTFDFATVGCGGLSLPVCSFIKELGKPVVHLGGGNQILYGIKGKRWDKAFSQYNWYDNNFWIRPLSEETPKNNKLVEDGCYW